MNNLLSVIMLGLSLAIADISALSNPNYVSPATPTSTPTPIAAATPTPAPAIPDDLAALSYDELVALKDKINLAMWEAEEWQEVTVPQGVWEVGVDIPAGHWTIKAFDGVYAAVTYGSKLDAAGNDLAYGSRDISEMITSTTYRNFDPNSDRSEISVDAKAGYYFVIEYGSAVFTPYAGKPSLGFK